MIDSDLVALILTLKLAAITTLILLVICIPLAWYFCRSNSFLRYFFEIFFSLPLVLPPTVLGFYLLLFFTKSNFLLNKLGISSLAFSFKGLVFASIIYSLPFVLFPLIASFSRINHRILNIANSLGMSSWQQLLRVVLPLSWRGVVSAAILGFAHCIGEFGIALMIGGSISGETKVLSIALYEYVEALEYNKAIQLSLVLFACAFFVLSCILFLLKPKEQNK